jgi:hypothetical protein
VPVIEGVLKVLVPVPLLRIDPPVAAAYQSIVSPAPGVADIVTEPVPQREPPVPAGALGIAFTTTLALPAELAHPLTVTMTE